jgi:hypothetical protein
LATQTYRFFWTLWSSSTDGSKILNGSLD